MPKKDRRQYARSVWDARHPLWKILQGVVGLALLAYAGEHIGLGEHVGTTVDTADVAGAGGLALAARLVYSMVRG